MATRATDPPLQAGVGPSEQAHDAELRAQFEERRLELFRSRGLAVEARRIADPDGRDTYVLVTGDGPCPTVLVHGGVGNTAEWADVAPRLTGPIVIPDRPGFGLTYPHDYRRVDYREDAARWLLDLVEGLGSEQVDLVANSMGGFVAIAFATAHPNRVRRLVLSGAASGLFPSLGVFLQLWATPGIGALISKMTIKDTEAVRKRLLGGYLTHPERLASDVLDVPTLFAWGDHDQLAKPEVAHTLARRMPNAQVAIIPDAGHLPHLDQPDAVAAALNTFLRT
jgi:pimeloyl-ACP methyl ester carboxylesterase